MTGSTFADHIAHQHHQSGVTLDVHSISKAVNNPDNKQGATILVRTWNHPVASCAGCMLPFRPWWKGRVQPSNLYGKYVWCCCWCLVIGGDGTDRHKSQVNCMLIGFLTISWHERWKLQDATAWSWDILMLEGWCSICPAEQSHLRVGI